MKISIMVAIIILLSNLTFACADETQNSTTPCTNCNLVIISLTSLRQENMSFYGHDRKTTPNIDHFFENSISFENVYAPASLTFTDAISFFYSLSPIVHRNFERFNKVKVDQIYSKNSSLTQMLHKEGYKTAAFVGDEDYSYDRGIGKTFEYYFDRALYTDHGIAYRPFTYSVGTKQLVPIANKWIKENKDKKFFLFLQAFDMHCPYAAEDDFAKLYQSAHSKEIPFNTECFMTQKDVEKDKHGRLVLKSFNSFMGGQEKSYFFTADDEKYLRSRYDAELNQTDHRLKPLLDQIAKLKLDKNTIVILMADHGDNLGDNGYYMKMSSTARGNLQRNNLRLPLLIKHPHIQKPLRQKQIIQSIDIAPSILEMLGLKTSTTMQGKSFLSIIGKETEHNDFAYNYSIRYNLEKIGKAFETSYTLESLIGKKWKIDREIVTELKHMKKQSEKYYLFDLESDPKETNNLTKKLPGKTEELKKILNEKQKKYERLE